MEFLDGMTLKHRIGGRPLETETILPWRLKLPMLWMRRTVKGLCIATSSPPIFSLPSAATRRFSTSGSPKLTPTVGRADAAAIEATAGVSAEFLTSPGTAVGTVAYMSPEQAKGKELDARTDLFSFGAVLYEMTTGAVPFRGDTSAVIFDAILNRSPAPALRLNPDVPARLEEIINKALEKDRDLRYQHASEIRSDLKRLQRDSGSSHRVTAQEEAEIPAQSQPSAVSSPAPASGSGTPSSQPSSSSSLPAQVSSSQAGASPVSSGQTSSARTASSSSVSAVAREHKFSFVAVVAVALVLVAAAGFGVYSLLTRSGPTPFQNFTITQITNTGKADQAAISPDGKYVLNVQNDNGLQSLWLRNVPTGSDTQIVPPAAAVYRSLAFSPDGNYVYFRKAGISTQSEWDLYRTPVLGGTPQIIVRDVDTGVAFSPDGHRIAYARANDPEVGKYRLLLANPDGSDETILRIAPIKGDLPRELSWSPDGKQITYTVFSLSDVLGTIDEFEIASKQVQPLVSFKNELVHEIVWLPGGQWLLAMYGEKGPSYLRSQIGLVSRAGGQIQPVTRDTNAYSALTVSADGKTVATVQVRITRSVDLIPGAGSPKDASVAGLSQAQDVQSLAWTADGKLLVSDGQGVRRMTVDGGSQTTLLNDPNSWIVDMTRCGDQIMALAWAFHGGSNRSGIWRTNADGSNPTQLTKGAFDYFPACSPDGKWLYYVDFEATRALWRVRVDGGEPAPVPATDVAGMYGVGAGMAISPDGKQLAFNAEISVVSGPQTAVSKLVLVDLESPQTAVRTLAPDPRIAQSGSYFTNTLVFTLDGKSLAYIIRDQGVDNIFVQPMDGTPGHQITNFTSEHIDKFNWSPDGKSLAVVRHDNTSDVVLLQER